MPEFRPNGPIVFLPGQHVYLRPTEVTDTPLIQRWINDPQVRQYLLPTSPCNEIAERRFIESTAQSEHDYILAIVRKSDDRHVGQTGLHGVNWVDRHARFGIFIGENDARGQGLGGEATMLMMKFAFEQLNLHRVELDVYDFNKRARGLYERLGFFHEGTRRDSHWRGGSYCNADTFSMLDREYFALSSP